MAPGSARSLALVGMAGALVLLGLVLRRALSSEGGPGAVAPQVASPAEEEAAAEVEVALPGARGARAQLDHERRTESESSVASRPPERELVGDEARVHGRVLSELDHTPIADVTLALFAGGTLLEQVVSLEGGGFSFSPASRGTHLAIAAPTGWAARADEVMLDPAQRDGASEVRILVRRWPPTSAGAIRGRLLSERGPWSPEDVPPTDHIMLDLVSREEPRIQLRAQLELQQIAGGAVYAFAFEDVPDTEYELTLSSLDNFRWSPTSLLVRPPLESVEFLRHDGDEALPLEFHVFDGASGERIHDFEAAHVKVTVSSENGVFMHAGPLDSELFPLDREFEWTVWADGYAPAFGDERAFTLVEGRRIAEVRLGSGWSTRFFVMGGAPATRPLGGAVILLDGEVVGRSDDQGWLEVHRAEAPDAIEVRYEDLVLAEDPLSGYRGATRARRAHVTPILLSPPPRDH